MSAVVEHVVDRFELRLGYRRAFERRSDRPLILMTQRRRLDHHLAERAAAAGADFRDAARAAIVSLDGHGAVVDVGGRRVRADVLVGADGANGVVAREARLGTDIVNGVALEGNVSWSALDRERYRGRAVVELGTVPGGYGWVFPKGDHANVGVGGWGSEGPRIRRHLERVADAHGVRLSAFTDLKGHRLPMRRLGAVPSAGRVLLVGDAAGLVDPLSGDGIYEAFVSAELAAAAIVRGDLPGYASALSAALDHHATASWAAKRALDRYPRTCFWAARAPGVFGVIAGLLAGDVRHPREARGLARPPLRLIARLAR